MTRTNETRHERGHGWHEAMALLAMLPARGFTALAWLIALVALLVAGPGLGR